MRSDGFGPSWVLSCLRVASSSGGGTANLTEEYQRTKFVLRPDHHWHLFWSGYHIIPPGCPSLVQAADGTRPCCLTQQFSLVAFILVRKALSSAAIGSPQCQPSGRRPLFLRWAPFGIGLSFKYGPQQ